MKNTLMLHGWGGKSNENWFPWLQSQIKYKAEELFIPNLPHTDIPVLEEQLDYICVYANDFQKKGNIIGHSLGSQLALHFVIEHSISHANIVLVAPSYSDIVQDIGRDVFGDQVDTIQKYFQSQIDFDFLNTLQNNITIFLSKNDPYIHIDSAKKFYSQIDNAVFVEFEDKGHFNTAAEVFTLPEILEYID